MKTPREHLEAAEAALELADNVPGTKDLEWEIRRAQVHIELARELSSPRSSFASVRDWRSFMDWEMARQKSESLRPTKVSDLELMERAWQAGRGYAQKQENLRLHGPCAVCGAPLMTALTCTENRKHPAEPVVDVT